MTTQITFIKQHLTKFAGRYRYEQLLGQGGMGVVFKAYDTLLERDVAIKILNEELRENREAQRIFMVEARNLATLKHPNLVAIHDVAIVDEVDSILIDEARTPLIISGPAQDSSALYKQINRFIPQLQPVPESEGEPQAGVEAAEGHYTVDEKMRQVELNEAGHQLVEDLLIQAGLLEEGDSLYSASNLSLLHHVNSALRAHVLFNNNVEYIVQNDQVVLIDEHTGRTMPGRRLSEGLHQAIEAKEGVTVQAESQTLASTTFQNYFRLFNKLAGMTGTADTEAFEFKQIYGLDVVVIPTNKPNARRDLNDLVYLSKEEKYDAIVEDVKGIVETGAPVLVGTASIETSEEMSKRFKQAAIPHKVLNAKYHEQEAEIIAQAGRPGVVTIATNMAGRGTDIVLGGNPEEQIKHMDTPSEAEAEKIRASADRQRTETLAQSYRKAQSARGEGDAQAAAIYAEAYNQDKEFFRFYRSLRAYKESFDQPEDVLILEPDSDFFRYMKGAKGAP